MTSPTIEQLIDERIARALDARLIVPTPEWLAPGEAAKRLGVSPKTLEAYRARRTGPNYFKREGVIRYRTTDLDAYMAKGRV